MSRPSSGAKKWPAYPPTGREKTSGGLQRQALNANHSERGRSIRAAPAQKQLNADATHQQGAASDGTNSEEAFYQWEWPWDEGSLTSSRGVLILGRPQGSLAVRLHQNPALYGVARGHSFRSGHFHESMPCFLRRHHELEQAALKLLLTVVPLP